MKVLNALITTHLKCFYEISALARGSTTQKYSELKLHIIFTVAYLNEGFSLSFLKAWHPSYQSSDKKMLFLHFPLYKNY